MSSNKKWFTALRAYSTIVMSRNVFILFAFLVLVEASAMGVIYSTYKSRSLFSQLASMRDDAEEMQVVWNQLLLEQSTLASFNRVAEVAHKNLKMKIPDPHTVVVLRQP